MLKHLTLPSIIPSKVSWYSHRDEKSGKKRLQEFVGKYSREKSTLGKKEKTDLVDGRKILDYLVLGHLRHS